ncbi:hypothetical protein HN371_22650, partial [Candidatus Poribacteria bacterium]|nr:hypothetical protein [Candidatus Poribacteria bacterium]
MKVATALVLCGCFAVAACASEEHIGLAWTITYAPDGTSLVYVAEHRVGRDSDYTLTLVTRMAGVRRATYSLTPRYGPAVASPSGDTIAYVASDFSLGSPVYVFGPGLRYAHPHPALRLRASLTGDLIQWSRDGAYLRHRVPRKSLPSHWRMFTVAGANVHRGEEPEVEWADSVEPTELPAYMTRRQPVISRDMPIVWQPDSGAVFVADEEGVWRATLGEPFMPDWAKIHTASDVQALAMSPSGDYLVVESGDAEERDIHELHLGDDGVEVRSVGVGWGVRFSPTEDTYRYSNYQALYRVVVGEERYGRKLCMGRMKQAAYP